MNFFFYLHHGLWWQASSGVLFDVTRPDRCSPSDERLTGVSKQKPVGIRPLWATSCNSESCDYPSPLNAAPNCTNSRLIGFAARSFTLHDIIPTYGPGTDARRRIKHGFYTTVCETRRLITDIVYRENDFSSEIPSSAVSWSSFLAWRG